METIKNVVSGMTAKESGARGGAVGGSGLGTGGDIALVYHTHGA